MKTLKKYIRNILMEAAGRVDNLPSDAIVIIKDNGWGYHVTLNFGDRTIGELLISQDPNRNGPCLNAFEVISSRASQGWGPMLYDIGMEIAGSNGLMTDRRQVSDEAYRVWEFYLTQRRDVQPKQLDVLRPRKFHGMLTPDDESDDCVQDFYFNRYLSSTYDLRKTHPKDIKPDEQNYLNSPLTKAFVKSGGSTIKHLKELGFLEDLR